MFHPKCEAQRPVTTVNGVCSTANCEHPTGGRHFAFCSICSIEGAQCESCGKTMQKRRPGGVTSPVLNPDAGGGPKGIAPGGCMPRDDGFARAAAMRYFENVEGFIKIDFGNHAEWVVHLQKPVGKPLPAAVWGHKLRYVYPASEKVVTAWVTAVLTAVQIGPAQVRLIKRLEGVQGVVSVERLFPDDTDPYFQRFYVLGFTADADAEAALAELQDMRSIEHVSKGARRDPAK